MPTKQTAAEAQQRWRGLLYLLASRLTYVVVALLALCWVGWGLYRNVWAVLRQPAETLPAGLVPVDIQHNQELLTKIGEQRAQRVSQGTLLRVPLGLFATSTENVSASPAESSSTANEKTRP